MSILSINAEKIGIGCLVEIHNGSYTIKKNAVLVKKCPYDNSRVKLILSKDNKKYSLNPYNLENGENAIIKYMSLCCNEFNNKKSIKKIKLRELAQKIEKLNYTNNFKLKQYETTQKGVIKLVKKYY